MSAGLAPSGQIQVVIDPELPLSTEGSVSFETGPSDLVNLVFGSGSSVGPLLAFYEALVSGLPMPLVFSLPKVSGPHSIVAAALFLRRDLTLNSQTLGLVYAVDLVYRLGASMLAHVDPDVSRFIRGLQEYFPEGLSTQEQGGRLTTAIQWVVEYITQGILPNLGSQSEEVRVLDVGTNGFVLAQGKPSENGWETLYRNGHLKGVIIGPMDEGLCHILIARKTFSVGFDLERAVGILDELETFSGGTPGWKLAGNYLSSPVGGTSILLTYITEVLLRI